MKTCVACSHEIDPSARLCPFCGAVPETGERVDTDSLLREEFGSKETSTADDVLAYARQRQGIVIAISLLLGFLALAGLHQWVTMRNASAVSDAPPVSLTEIADLARESQQVTPIEIPEPDFVYDGNPDTMRTLIVEPGAVAPPPPAPAQGTQPTPPTPAR